MIRGMSRAILALSVGALTAFTCGTASAATYRGLAAPVVFTDDFENGLINGKGWIISGNAPVVSTDMVRDGKYAMKTVLNRLTSPKSFRTEVSQSGFVTVPVGGDIWYGFSIGLPNSYVKDNIWEIVAQWHSVPDTNLGEHNYIQNPPLSLHTGNGVWTISSIWDSKPLTTKDTYEGKKNYNLGAYETGKFTDWVFHIRWSPKSDGLLQVWKDGKQVVNTPGPLGFNDAVAPYFKMGIYKGWTDRVSPVGIVSQRVLYHDAIKVAVGSNVKYEDVAPGGKPATSGSSTSQKPQPPSGVQIRTE